MGDQLLPLAILLSAVTVSTPAARLDENTGLGSTDVN